MFDEDKNDHHLVVNTYSDHSIVKDSFATPIACLLTVLFLYQKLNDNFMTKWQVCFYPLYVILALKFIGAFIRIISYEANEPTEENPMDVKFRIRIKNLEKIILISNFFSLVYQSLLIMTVYFVAEFLDRKDDNYLFYSLYMISGYCGSHLLYSLLRTLSAFSMKREGHGVDGENGASHSSIAFLSSMTAPILTYFSNMLIICNSGVCTQIYASTISSLLGAFGVSMSNFNAYLFPMTMILLGVSLFSLYVKKKSLTHGPFLLGVFACSLIVVAHYVEPVALLTWPGNILMIVAAIWNAKMNKFSGLPRFKK
jgi:hypothetical protein